MTSPRAATPAPGEPPGRPIVPLGLLARFGASEATAVAASGQLIMERRDRTRRVLASVEEAGRVAGAFRLERPSGDEPGTGADAPTRLTRLLADVDAAAEAALEGVVAGRFPPTPAERPRIALFVALRLLLGRGARVGQQAASSALAEVVENAVGLALARSEEGEDDEDEEAPDEGEAGASDPVGPERTSPEPVVAVCSNDPPRVDLSPLMPLARLLAGRTWQLARFQEPVLLTGDTPAVAWRKAGAGDAPPTRRLADVDEVRVPLGPRHALVMARVARLGEVIRDLEPRHAAALNRTVAEAAREWVFYHPEADPLREVALAPP
jgi:hypothetical protein